MHSSQSSQLRAAYEVYVGRQDPRITSQQKQAIIDATVAVVNDIAVNGYPQAILSQNVGMIMHLALLSTPVPSPPPGTSAAAHRLVSVGVADMVDESGIIIRLVGAHHPVSLVLDVIINRAHDMQLDVRAVQE